MILGCIHANEISEVEIQLISPSQFLTYLQIHFGISYCFYMYGSLNIPLD